MTTNNDKWTFDLLRQPQGMNTYCDQVRLLGREMREEFRALTMESYDDLKAHRRDGDNFLKARFNAWRVSRKLRAMERHAQAIMSAATGLNEVYRTIYVDAPKNHGRKAIPSSFSGASSVNSRELPADLQGSAGAGSAPSVFDLFGGAS